MECQIDLTGIFFGLIVAAMGFGVAYELWPNGVMDIPIAALTLGQLVRFIGAAVFGIIGIVGLGAAAHHTER